MMLTEDTPVPASSLPMAAFKAHLRLGSGFADDDLQDGVLETALRASLAAIEARTGKILFAREFTFTLNDWRDPYDQPLPVAPVSAISEVTVIDRQGAETVTDSDRWYLEPDAMRPRLRAAGGCLPTVPLGGRVRVGMLAGYGPEWDDLPADLAQAVLQLAAHFNAYRHDVAMRGQGIPAEVQALIAPFRTVRLLGGGAR